PGESSEARFVLKSEVTGIIERMDVINGCGEAPSPSVEVVPSLPEIVDQHDDVLDACVGSIATFMVVASGPPPLTYQWFLGPDPIAGATGPELNITVQSSDAGSYTVQVSNAGGTVTSTAALLTVLEPAAITTPPEGDSICQGDVDSVTFSVEATGSPILSYQWFKGPDALAGETGSSLTINDPTVLDEGSYTVEVTNTCTTVVSDPAILIVDIAPAIGEALVDQVVCQEDVTQVVFEVLSISGKPTPMLQWYKNDSPLSGETASSLTLTDPDPDDDGTYKLIASNDCGTAQVSALLTVNVDPEITTALVDVMITEGEDAVFTVEATGKPEPTYAWSKDGNPIAGETGASLSIDAAEYEDGGNYTVTVTNDCGEVTSTALLDVNRIPTITCNSAFELWSPQHDLVDVGSVFSVSDPDGDQVTLSLRVFSDESEIPETGDGTGKHAPDFKNEIGGRGLLLRSERRGREDGRWYVIVVTADDGQGGVLNVACGAAACPHDQNAESMADVMAQLAAATAAYQGAIDANGGAIPSFPLAGHYEHGLAAPLGPKQ
ncbi:MAG: immunoglobulin domain-containing protein, partial [Planctomycetota bacterium]